MRRAFARSVSSALIRSKCLVGAVPTLVKPTATFCQLRCYATHSELRDALLNELQEEEGRQDKLEQPQIPGGFSVNREPSSTKFSLTKKHSDESLEVQCAMMEPTGTKDGEVQAKMTLIVTKGTQALRFELATVEDELVIIEVAHFKDAAAAKDRSLKGVAERENVYSGPVVNQLDESVTNGFVSYRQDRGVDDQFASFVVQYAFWLEQGEYENWLGSVSKFVS